MVNFKKMGMSSVLLAALACSVTAVSAKGDDPVVAVGAIGKEVSVGKDVPKEVGENIKKFSTEVIKQPLLSIDVTPIKNVYEVVLEPSNIFYMDGGGDYAILGGAMLDIKNERNLTAERVQELSAVDLKALPKGKNNSFKVGKGKTEIVVFADPNCIHCQRLEKELNGSEEFTLKVFPIAILGENSVEKVRDILCSKDPAKAWDGWMLDKKAPEKAAKSCDVEKAMEENISFAMSNGINQTPTIILPNGEVELGFRGKDFLIDRIGATKK